MNIPVAILPASLAASHPSIGSYQALGFGAFLGLFGFKGVWGLVLGLPRFVMGCLSGVRSVG